MPLPAGTGLDRRSFLLRSAGLALAVYGATSITSAAFDEGVARAAAAPAERVLVSIYLEGGLDALSALAPVGDPRYASLRPTLALSPDEGTPFAEDDRLHWHPAAGGLATLHGEGKVSVMPAIGYDHPNQSHFTSRHFGEAGDTDTGAQKGWLGRYLDLHGTNDNPLQGLSLSDVLMPTLAAGSVPIATLARLGEYGFSEYGVGSAVQKAMYETFRSLGESRSASPGMAEARAAALQAALLREQLLGIQVDPPPVAYPDGDFASRIAAVPTLMAAGMPLRCVALYGAGSYDTHAGQADTFATQLQELSDTLLAFQRDLEARGLADRVIVHVWSEFGRRPQENGDRGTDHGAAGLGLLIGSRVRGQMVGEFPGLATLDSWDNLRATSDFRAVYCSLLEQWLGADAGPVIPGADAFDRPQLIAA